MDIDGLGETLVGTLLSRGLVGNAADLYDLRAEQLLELDGFAEISARNLINAIDASRSRPFHRVLFAIGIEEVGYVTARSLANQFARSTACWRLGPSSSCKPRASGRRWRSRSPRSSPRRPCAG